MDPYGHRHVRQVTELVDVTRSKISNDGGIGSGGPKGGMVSVSEAQLRAWWSQLSEDNRAALVQGARTSIDGRTLNRIVQRSPAWTCQLFDQGVGGFWHLTEELKEFVAFVHHDANA